MKLLIPRLWLWPMTIALVFLAVLSGAAAVFFGGRSVVPVSSQVSIGGMSFQVEVADTDAGRKQGLGFRDELCEQCGMLFVFDEPGIYRFWMQGMRFPIDIVFIARSKVLSVEREVASDDNRIFSPPEPVDFVLEVNAGAAKAVTPGMPVAGLPQL